MMISGQEGRSIANLARGLGTALLSADPRRSNTKNPPRSTPSPMSASMRSSAVSLVSKRWLMLLSSIRASELSFNNIVSLESSKKPLPDLNLEGDGDEEEIESFGCLTRCLEEKEVTDVRLSAIAVGTAGRGGLGKLSIRGSHPIRGLTDLGLSAVGRCCPSLSVLSLWKVPYVTDAGLAELANGCPMLEKLDLSDCPLVTGKGLMAVAKRCPNLMSVTIDSCVGIGNEGLQTIGRFCPKLQSVSIKGCPLINDQGIAGMMCSASSSLAKLKLQNLNVSDLALACIGHYGKAITELYLTGLQNVAERGFWCMGNAKGLLKLKSIAITSCRGVTDTGLEAVAKGCPSLKQLCLRKCCYLSDAGLKAFIEAARSLEHLQLEECYRITLVGVLTGVVNGNTKLKTLSLVRCLGIKDIGCYPNVLPSCKSLRSLTIRDCPGFTSASLAVVGKICPSLINLDLGGLDGVTDAGLLPLIESSEEGLINVNLRGCVNLTDSAVCALVKAHGDTLQLLNLDGCNKLTDRVLLAISEHCTMLEELDMSRADITDYGVALLASARHLSLRILSVAGCSKVTPRSLPFFGNMGPTLVGLNLQHCSLIAAHGITSLEERMWWCDILS
ncbi:uncharacterized protein A4U43_C01F24800 [Asparagus officinalis]|uniref:F-box/LRR-repeat protein 15-like leucin rich repeat domain-containing protein n=1 Tax=Asparagus officinalis TaxID=4686 RepID=A0A5P1FW28_ASPOF|nr:uncharacterized protein A4U43_C01F24800 [Asparagus officinalis]